MYVGDQKTPYMFASGLFTPVVRFDSFFHRCGGTAFVRAFGKEPSVFGIAYTRASGFFSHSIPHFVGSLHLSMGEGRTQHKECCDRNPAQRT